MQRPRPPARAWPINILLSGLAFGLLALAVRMNRGPIDQVLARPIDWGLFGLGFAALLAGPRAGAQEASSGTVAEVSVDRVNVFDPRVPGEGIWPFRAANRIHILTRERVVRQELLLAPGDAWDSLRAEESGRNLRALNLFRVARVSAVPRPDEIKGEAICVFVTLKTGEPTEELKQELRKHVRTQIGAHAMPDDVHFAAALPKTRSGKIMRRLLRDIASGKAEITQDTTTLEDFSVLAKLAAPEE